MLNPRQVEHVLVRCHSPDVFENKSGQVALMNSIKVVLETPCPRPKDEEGGTAMQRSLETGGPFKHNQEPT